MTPWTSTFSSAYSLTPADSSIFKTLRTPSPIDDLLAHARDVVRALAHTVEDFPLDQDQSGNCLTHLCLRYDGAWLGEGIALANGPHQAIERAVVRTTHLAALVHAARVAKAHSLDPTNPTDRLPSELVDLLCDDRLSIDIVLCSQTRYLVSQELAGVVGRGTHALGLLVEGRFALAPPSWWIATNSRHDAVVTRLWESVGRRPAGSLATSSLMRFDVLHLSQQHRKSKCCLLRQGDTTVESDAVAPAALDGRLKDMGQWFLSNQRCDGHLPYKYWPSRGEYSASNNWLRQWMATQALAELYSYFGDSTYLVAWQANLTHNLAASYVADSGLGYIVDGNAVKLGAGACALMAILAGPETDLYAPIAHSLLRFLIYMGKPDGSFRTFLRPEHRNDNQAFYPGEALLAIARFTERFPNSALLEQMSLGRNYYLGWHRRTGRNPAFIPWHTMAYWRMHRLTGQVQLQRDILELNDWLVCLQDLNESTPAAEQGAFFRSGYAHYGPRHASSTAVYVEGLAHAYDAAIALGDEVRAATYLEAARQGLRSIVQLQFRPENAFYLRHKTRVLGAIRTDVANNELRCDNTQHAVMAVLACLRLIPADAWSQDSAPIAARFRAECFKRLAPQVAANR